MKVNTPFLLFLFLSATAITAQSCGEDEIQEAAPGGGTGTPNDTGGEGTVDVDEEDEDVGVATNEEVCPQPICFRFQTRWEETNLEKQLWQECTSSSNGETCEIEVPEATLYFSDLYFEISTNSGDCFYLEFQPYAYRLSESSGFKTADGADLDCSGADGAPPKACYNGVATEIIGDFPKANLSYFKTNTATSITYKAPSANSVDRVVTSYGNRYMVNFGFPTAAQVVASGGTNVDSGSGTTLDETLLVERFPRGGGVGPQFRIRYPASLGSDSDNEEFIEQGAIGSLRQAWDYSSSYHIRCKNDKAEELATMELIVRDINLDSSEPGEPGARENDFCAWETDGSFPSDCLNPLTPVDRSY